MPGGAGKFVLTWHHANSRPWDTKSRGRTAYGGTMTSLETMARIAARYDTAMSWAMLRALSEAGVSACAPRTRRHAYDHLVWCFRNHGSPMDLPWRA